jgi:hypothetical protein
MLEVFCNRGELLQFAAILEKVQMPPAPFVVLWTPHNALKTAHAKCSPERILAIPSAWVLPQTRIGRLAISSPIPMLR